MRSGCDAVTTEALGPRVHSRAGVGLLLSCPRLNPALTDHWYSYPVGGQASKRGSFLPRNMAVSPQPPSPWQLGNLHGGPEGSLDGAP